LFTLMRLCHQAV